MVSDVTINTTLDQQSKTAAAQTGLAEDFAQFLTLLTVQLQNQDPLSPMDTTEFTNQLVAFTGVEQQINTNQKLDSLVSLQLANSFSSSLDYVGKDISYISSEFNYDGEGDVKINYAFSGDPVFAKINVYNEEGDLVYTEDAQKSVGNHEFIWDGTMTGGGVAEPGTYQVKLDALDIDDEPVTSTTVVNGHVRGIETQGGLIFLLVGERAVSVGNVLNVTEAPTPPAEEPPAEEEESA